MKHDRYSWNKKPPREFRWRCGLRQSRWFKTERAACNSAVRNGLGWWEGDSFIYGPLVVIEYRPAAA